MKDNKKFIQLSWYYTIFYTFKQFLLKIKTRTLLESVPFLFFIY